MLHTRVTQYLLEIYICSFYCTRYREFFTDTEVKSVNFNHQLNFLYSIFKKHKFNVLNNRRLII